MKPVPMALAAALAGTVSLAAAPTVYAEEISPAHYRMGPGHGGHMQPDGNRFGHAGSPAGGPLVALVCTEQGASRLEAVFDRVAQGLDLTDEQTSAFEDFKTASLAAQTAFADACMAVRDDRPDDLVEAVRNRRTVLSAQIEAIDSVLPSFEALYDSLTDAQKLMLVRMRPGPAQQRPGSMHERWDGGRQGPEELR